MFALWFHVSFATVKIVSESLYNHTQLLYAHIVNALVALLVSILYKYHLLSLIPDCIMILYWFLTLNFVFCLTLLMVHLNLRNLNKTSIVSVDIASHVTKRIASSIGEWLLFVLSETKKIICICIPNNCCLDSRTVRDNWTPAES